MESAGYSETYFLHFQDRKIISYPQDEDIRYSSILKMEADDSSETLIIGHQPARAHIPEGSYLTQEPKIWHLRISFINYVLIQYKD
jgi:hypothetical protein